MHISLRACSACLYVCHCMYVYVCSSMYCMYVCLSMGSVLVGSFVGCMLAFICFLSLHLGFEPQCACNLLTSYLPRQETLDCYCHIWDLA